MPNGGCPNEVADERKTGGGEGNQGEVPESGETVKRLNPGPVPPN
jgi:hypothetical protein